MTGGGEITPASPPDLPGASAVAPTAVAPTSVAPATVAPTSVAPTSVAPATVAPATVAPTSGLGPLGDVQMLAAMLRNDRNDVASYARVLTGSLGDALPPGVVAVQYQRSMGDRMAGRPGRPVRLLVRGSARELELAEGAHGAVEATSRTIVGGVVIARKQIGIDEWVQQFAAELSAMAEANGAARQALAALLGME